jgi:hypothetical protein
VITGIRAGGVGRYPQPSQFPLPCPAAPGSGPSRRRVDTDDVRNQLVEDEPDNLVDGQVPAAGHYLAIRVERHQVQTLLLFGDVHPDCNHFGDTRPTALP